MVSDKKIHRAFRARTIYTQNPLEKFLIFTIYQNYTLALNNAFKVIHYILRAGNLDVVNDLNHIN